MKSERILGTFLLTVIGLIILAVLRPSSPNPLEDTRAREAWFFINKTHQDKKYDCVILGDSRGLRGLSPTVMMESLQDLDIFNFSFKAGGMNKEMFTATENLLDSNSPRPVILLAPTALAFMPEKTANSQYHEYLHKPWDQVWLYQNVPVLAEWFQPLSPSLFFRREFNIQPKKSLCQIFHAEGWIESDQQPHDDLSDLTATRERMSGHLVDTTMIDEFMAGTAAWTSRGITVLAFLPPSYPPRIAAENRISQFDVQKFRARFEQAGGIWLDIPQDGFDSYDGSHLTADSARKLSRMVATACAEVLY